LVLLCDFEDCGNQCGGAAKNAWQAFWQRRSTSQPHYKKVNWYS
jgi:hypothetical protein